MYMPFGYWHHMEYVECGFAMSLRALQHTLSGKLHGAWNLTGMRTIDTLMKKTLPYRWHNWKEKKAQFNASKYLHTLEETEIADHQGGISSVYDLLWKKER